MRVRPAAATPTVALLIALAGVCQAQNAMYPPWPPPAAPAPQPAYSPPSGSPRPPAPPPQGPAVDYGPAPAAAPNAAEPGAPRNPQLVTPGQEGAQSLTTAAEAPFHEMNLVHEHIPPVLLASLADPYAYPNPLTCESLSESIARLTVALGPDFDNPPPKKARKVTGSGGLGLQLLNGAAGNLLPFHGYIGTLSGSSKHDELIIRAIGAGAAQRAYLKGLGEARGCQNPAAPRHHNPPAPPVYDGPRRPKYPIG